MGLEDRKENYNTGIDTRWVITGSVQKT